ncbi:MAG TPA: winged helix DNA-binding domain-containing protein [Saprospiraceae bacterium]|nr:winged helix DNA-binding domain-containing protein [Saprospiraceae bacterium]
MTFKEIIAHRLLNQQIAETTFTSPQEIVSHLGAMQSQDWAMAKWAIGLRLPGSKEADIEKAFNEGRILRTHMLRPTWHFVAPADIKWMQALTSPRVQAFNASYYRNNELDQKIFKKCNAIMVKSLRDHHYLTRNELNEEFKKAKINTDDLRLSLIMMNAELEGLICSGPRKGKQFTYALMDEKTPQVSTLKKDEALHKLTSIYFKTRGPAMIQDYTWWSGLTVKEAKEGLSSLGKKITSENIDGKEFFFFDQPLKDINKLNTTFLFPDYDEYGISYKDRSIYNHPKALSDQKTKQPYFIHAICVNGYFGGSWNRPTGKNNNEIQIQALEHLTKKQLSEVKKAVKNYNLFFTTE